MIGFAERQGITLKKNICVHQSSDPQLRPMDMIQLL